MNINDIIHALETSSGSARRPAFVKEPGETILEPGQTGKFMYLIKSGTADITVGDQVVESVTTGGIIGEMALLEDAPRSAMVVAKHRTELIPVNRRSFEQIVQNQPGFALHVMKILSQRLRASNAD